MMYKKLKRAKVEAAALAFPRRLVLVRSPPDEKQRLSLRIRKNADLRTPYPLATCSPFVTSCRLPKVPSSDRRSFYSMYHFFEPKISESHGRAEGQRPRSRLAGPDADVPAGPSPEINIAYETWGPSSQQAAACGETVGLNPAKSQSLDLPRRCSGFNFRIVALLTI
jgi:hypothetical protein